MIREAFETRPVVAQLIDRYPELEQHRITADDWHALKATRDFLEPFWQVTLQTEGKDVTLDEMQTTMDFIIYHLQRSEEKYASDNGLLAVVNTYPPSFVRARRLPQVEVSCSVCEFEKHAMLRCAEHLSALSSIQQLQIPG